MKKIQNKLKEEKTQEKSPEGRKEDTYKIEQQISNADSLIYGEFSENLKIIKELQSQMDGLTVEMKIRGEMIIERDNKIAELEKELHDLETQISIFKSQIAPALEQTITKLRTEKEKLQSIIEGQRSELLLKEERIQASHNILKKAGMNQLFQIEDYQIDLTNKNKIIEQQEKKIKKLKSQVDQLPIICLKMTNEIKKRESEIHSLKIYNNVLNKKLKIPQQEFETAYNVIDENFHDLTRRLMEVQDLLQKEKNKTAILDKEILMLNSLIMEKESKITRLEKRVQSLIFVKKF